MTGLPTGTVTFLFTDLEGSTGLWERQPAAMEAVLARHDDLLRHAVEDHDGVVVKTTGDGIHAAFARAVDAIAAAVTAQQAIAAEPWPVPEPVLVRMGVHTGEAALREGDYFGTAVNRAARVSAVAHGGQVLVSHATEELVRDHLSPDLTLADLGEQRLRDLSRPERIFQLQAPGLPTDFPPLRVGAEVPTNLPLMATDLIGRDEEVAELVASITRRRLVTLAGPGGIGKTRLAMEVAAVVGGDFADGAWFVDLAPVTEDDDVSGAVAAAMGASGVAGTPAALLAYLAQRRLVLVLDNCEHVIDGAAALAEDLLAGAPDVRTIATSRELLDVAGEAVHWVNPLEVPAGTDLDGSPAVDLFVARARAVRPDFALDADNVEDVAEICRRLDGVPLAIELAAARVVSMAPHDIRTRLGERFRLLSGGRRRQDRHRTLQAAVGWSYDLLDPEDQRVFRSLSVFGGPFDLAAAAEVVGGDEFEVADAVAGLARRSLVGHHGGTGRYRLLETLRQFGADRLVEAGETGAAQERFADHMIGLARDEGRRFDSRDTAEAASRLHGEMDNLRAVAEWLAEIGRPDTLVELTRDLWLFLSNEAPSIGRAWIDPIVDRGEPDDPQLRYDAVWLAGACAIVEGDLDRTLAMVERGRALLAADDRISESPWSLHPELMIAANTFDGPALRKLGDRMLVVAARRTDRTAANFAASMQLITMKADTAEFEQRLTDLLAEIEATGNPRWLATTLSCACGPLVGTDLQPASERDRAVTLLETHPGWEEVSGLFDVVFANTLGMALTGRDPVEAARTALGGVRVGDRLGMEILLTNCLEPLLLATATLGQTMAATRLRAELLHGTRHPIHARPTLFAEVDRLLAEQGIGPAEPAPPLSRRALLDLVDEIEAGLDKGPVSASG